MTRWLVNHFLLTTSARARAPHFRPTQLSGDGLHSAIVKERAEFVIDGREAGPGEPEATLSGIRNDVPVKLTPLERGVWAAHYVADTKGSYLLNVLWSGERVPDCPLKVSATERDSGASKVIVQDGRLKNGVVGEEMKAFIDTRNAGKGHLRVHCHGPSKPAQCRL